MTTIHDSAHAPGTDHHPHESTGASLSSTREAQARNAVLMAILGQYMDDIAASARAFEGYSEDDFMMDSIVKLLARQPELLLPEYGQDPLPWVRTVVINQQRDAYRAQNRHERILSNADRLPGDHWIARLLRMGSSPEEVVMRKLDELDVVKRIARLPDQLADVALLRYQGDSVAEISATLGITPNAVSGRLHKIRSPKVRQHLGLPAAGGK